jgi:L-ascorbate metabolism protein UlaG (beta-lactamase superfamily)
MIIVVILAILIICTWLVLTLYPPFGARASKEKIHTFQKSNNYVKRKFVYFIPTEMETSVMGMISILVDFIKGNPKGKPKESIPMVALNLPLVRDQKPKITWFGHSAFLLEMDDKTILLDPMFGRAPTPFPFFGLKRYGKELPFKIEDLPQIDAVFLSHDHYDHLDYGTIKQIKNKVKQFIVPLGVGSHLERWGVDYGKIIELDWWNEIEWKGLKLACTPARHFSGRSLMDRDSTLWCSWVIESVDTKIYFSGDSGYGPHFKEIGEKYGPFDLTLLECGQYDKRWAAIHMLPEETVQANIDLNGKVMIPIHWGAFTLALHDWTDPIERVTKAAKKQNISISTPKIGQTVHISTENYPDSEWWK